LFRTAPEQRSQQAIDASVAATEPLLALLEAQLAGQPFLAGDTMTMADLPIACELHRWWGLPLEFPARPRLRGWYDRMLALPAARGALDVPLS
jgi:glutathione S-transferase